MVFLNINCNNNSNREGVARGNKNVHIIISKCEQEEFENGGFTPKAHQMFCIHTAPKKSKNVTITSHY